MNGNHDMLRFYMISCSASERMFRGTAEENKCNTSDFCFRRRTLNHEGPGGRLLQTLQCCDSQAKTHFIFLLMKICFCCKKKKKKTFSLLI